MGEVGLGVATAAEIKVDDSEKLIPERLERRSPEQRRFDKTGACLVLNLVPMPHVCGFRITAKRRDRRKSMRRWPVEESGWPMIKEAMARVKKIGRIGLRNESHARFLRYWFPSRSKIVGALPLLTNYGSVRIVENSVTQAWSLRNSARALVRFALPSTVGWLRQRKQYRTIFLLIIEATIDLLCGVSSVTYCDNQNVEENQKCWKKAWNARDRDNDNSCTKINLCVSSVTFPILGYFELFEYSEICVHINGRFKHASNIT